MSPADTLATAFMNGMTGSLIGVGILIVGFLAWEAIKWMWRNHIL